MDKKRIKLSDQVRRAVDASGLTRYRISKIAGLHESVLCRFMPGEIEITTGTLDRLADALGLDIVVRPKRRRKG